MIGTVSKDITKLFDPVVVNTLTYLVKFIYPHLIGIEILIGRVGIEPFFIR